MFLRVMQNGLNRFLKKKTIFHLIPNVYLTGFGNKPSSYYYYSLLFKKISLEIQKNINISKIIMVLYEEAASIVTVNDEFLP